MLNELVVNVARIRSEVEMLDKEFKAQEAAFLAETEELRSKINELKNAQKAAELELKQRAINEFEKTGNKKPHNAVGIRVTKIVKFGEKEALNWALAHNITSVVKLNTTQFKKIAKVMEDVPAEIEEQVGATIARDLSEYAQEGE